MIRKRKQSEYPEIKIPNEEFITVIYKLNFNLDEIAKAKKMTIDELYDSFDKYHNSLVLKLEQDKQKRKDIKALFLNIKKGLKELRESMPNLPPRDLPPKNYCEVNLAGKWVIPELKPLGRQSFVYELKKEDMEGI